MVNQKTRKISPGALLNKMYRMREMMRRKQKEVDALQSEFAHLKEEFIMACHRAGTQSIKSTKATGTVTKKMVANVKDWPSFEEWLYENKALYMMYRRANVAPIREYIERSEDGLPPPGIETLEVFDVSIVTRGNK